MKNGVSLLTKWYAYKFK